MYPSNFAQMLTGLLIFYVIIMIIYRQYNGSMNMNSSDFNEYMIVLLFAIAIGVHGLLHAYAEINFDFNPLNDKWHYRLNPRLIKKKTV